MDCCRGLEACDLKAGMAVEKARDGAAANAWRSIVGRTTEAILLMLFGQEVLKDNDERPHEVNG